MEKWAKEIKAAITICDASGVILDMNDKSEEFFKNYGGKKLLGSNIFDCHPEKAKEKLKKIMDNQKVNIYTIEKNGVKKMIYQEPWYIDGKYEGFIEIAFEIPLNIPHFVR